MKLGWMPDLLSGNLVDPSASAKDPDIKSVQRVSATIRQPGSRRSIASSGLRANGADLCGELMRVRFDHARAKPNPRDPRFMETPYLSLESRLQTTVEKRGSATKLAEWQLRNLNGPSISCCLPRIGRVFWSAAS